MDATLGSTQLEESDELERLRRRAYGPDADIAGDAAAQARLFVLEAAQRRQPSRDVDAAATLPTPVSERVAVPVPSEAPIADSSHIDAAPPTPWWRRRWVAILGVAIVALALNAALIAWMSQLIAEGSTPERTETSTAKVPRVPDGQGRGYLGPAPDYVLALESVGADADAPNDRHGILDALGISTDELRRYEDFSGLNVWSGESRYGLTCLFVAVPVQGLREGFGGEGCSPEGLDTIADLQMPTVINLTRFVLRGDRVHVYEYLRAADPGASQG